MPFFDLGIKPWLKRCFKLPPLNGALHVAPPRSGGEAPQPTPVWRDQFFFAFSMSRTCNTSWTMLLSFIGDNAIISDTAATMIQVMGEARI